MSISSKNSTMIFFVLLTFCLSSHAQTWEKLNIDFVNNYKPSLIADIAFQNDKIGWLIFNGYVDSIASGKHFSRIYKTTNGGDSWILQKEKIANIEGHFVRLFILDSLHLWVLGHSFSPTFDQEQACVDYSTDGGITWNTVLINNFTSTNLGPIFFFNESEGIVFKDYPYFTKDGGMNWTVGDTSKRLGTSDVFFINRDIGWMVGAKGVSIGFIAKTIDKGYSWDYKSDSLFTPILTSVAFADSLHGFCIGNNSNLSSGVIYWTQDGGETWERKQIYGSGGFWDIGFIDKENGWITGDGRVWKTTDGGRNWSYEYLSSSAVLLKIVILKNEKKAYILAGQDKEGKSSIFRAVDLPTGIKETTGKLPSDFRLLQNYPNPFNQSTMIRYQIPIACKVTLKIYDMLGHHIATLLNEEKQPGSYEVKFDGNNLASGVYFYSLHADFFTQIKKIILLK